MESSGRLIILLVAGVIVAFAAIAIRNHMAQEPAAPESTAASKRVLTAKHDISLGTLVQTGVDVDWADPPPEYANKEDLLHEGVVRLEDFSGAVARRAIKAGEPLTSSALTKSGEGGFMSAVLEPGMRAVSVSVNATSGNAGFISPGDHVDLLVTHHIKQGGSGTDSIVGETFVYDVRVLAVDQMLDNPENKAILAKTVTVEVTPHQAEQVAVASELGKISMALRSLTQDDKSAAQAQPQTSAAPVAVDGDNKPVAEPPAADKKESADHAITDLYGNGSPADSSIKIERKPFSPIIRVIRGDQSENVEF